MVNWAHWHYYISLEADFVGTLDFVELSLENENTYSDNFAKLLIAVGSETDGIAKAVCKSLSSSSRAKNILEYRSELKSAFSGVETIEISVFRTGQIIYPLTEWGLSPPTSPGWWRAYNNVKHDRILNAKEANQGNCLRALAGLFAFNLYYYRNEQMVWPFPSLLNYNFPSFLLDGSMTRPPGA